MPGMKLSVKMNELSFDLVNFPWEILNILSTKS